MAIIPWKVMLNDEELSREQDFDSAYKKVIELSNEHRGSIEIRNDDRLMRVVTPRQ